MMKEMYKAAVVVASTTRCDDIGELEMEGRAWYLVPHMGVKTWDSRLR